jgi:hypothetical protein
MQMLLLFIYLLDMYSNIKLHNEELHDLYSSPAIVRVIKSRMRWAENVALMGRG